MRITIVGAGSVGTHLATQTAWSGKMWVVHRCHWCGRAECRIMRNVQINGCQYDSRKSRPIRLYGRPQPESDALDGGGQNHLPRVSYLSPRVFLLWMHSSHHSLVCQTTAWVLVSRASPGLLTSYHPLGNGSCQCWCWQGVSKSSPWLPCWSLISGEIDQLGPVINKAGKLDIFRFLASPRHISSRLSWT